MKRLVPAGCHQDVELRQACQNGRAGDGAVQGDALAQMGVRHHPGQLVAEVALPEKVQGRGGSGAGELSERLHEPHDALDVGEPADEHQHQHQHCDPAPTVHRGAEPGWRDGSLP